MWFRLQPRNASEPSGRNGPPEGQLSGGFRSISLVLSSTMTRSPFSVLSGGTDSFSHFGTLRYLDSLFLDTIANLECYQLNITHFYVKPFRLSLGCQQLVNRFHDVTHDQDQHQFLLLSHQ